MIFIYILFKNFIKKTEFTLLSKLMKLKNPRGSWKIHKIVPEIVKRNNLLSLIQKLKYL